MKMEVLSAERQVWQDSNLDCYFSEQLLALEASFIHSFLHHTPTDEQAFIQHPNKLKHCIDLEFNNTTELPVLCLIWTIWERWISLLISITENETAPHSFGATTSDSLPQSNSTPGRSPANPDILNSCHESTPYRSNRSQSRLASAWWISHCLNWSLLK